MFRAVSPYYYALDPSGSGNMFLYNDATYLSERLAELAASWKGREDLVPRAIHMLRLDNDITTLKSFAARAYSSEMTTQRTIIRDLLGGIQNVLQQEGDASDLFMQVEAATSRVRTVAAMWSNVLSKSAWCQAVGSLVDSLASKIISDVLELPAIGQDEAYNTANLIAKITELDDLFMPAGAGQNAVPTTSQYAENWLRLKFLSEFLQSNLNEVKYLWMESDLSLYFTVDEVIDLIGLSFADSPRTREVIREIRQSVQPRA
jgi:protein transport protein DSL1/ZW10